MPPETLETLQDLEITGSAESPGYQQDETQYEEPIESHGRQQQQPAQAFHPSAPHHPVSQAHTFEQPHSSSIYPPLLDPFGFDNTSTLPIDPGLLDARFDHPAAPGPGGGGVAGFHQGPWPAQPATSANVDSFVASTMPLPQYNSSMPLVPGISSFEPMVSTAWPMDGGVPSTAASGSRGPTMSSSMSARDTSTPASSHSPSSPRKVSAGIIEPPAASIEALPNRLGMQLEQGAEDQPSKKRTSFATPPVSIAPAPIGVDSSSDGNKQKDGTSGSNQSQTTTPSTAATTTMTTTTNNSPSGPSQPGPSSQTTTLPAQPPDPRARNREAANRCRAKSKVAVAELEATERAMDAENQALTHTARTLRDEVLTLKNELLMHGNCDDGLIQQYLVNSARMVGSGALGTTFTGTITTGGLPMQPPGPMPPGGPQLVIPPGAGGSSSLAMLPGSTPRLVPGMPLPPPPPPPPSAPGAGTIVARGHQSGGGGARNQ
ncbi:hypothetical protein F5883DRAFT_65726 [Diaporthe sp. PMI_573]|nr:hypothetical protein F5883DRAFT_65726 [Diaporthaceae sp. PMI_573]